MPLEFAIAGLGDDAVDYLDAWELQRGVHAEVVAGSRDDTVLLLEHPPVFTAGKRTDPHERPADPGGAPIIDVDRGGKITFHGPGQLVGYPIVSLPDHVKVVDYVRRVEEALIHVCADFGVAAARVPGRSGVWLRATGGGVPRPERKIAALGIRVSRGVTMHGFALNCDVDLGWYDRFVPCGIADAGVTSLSRELGRHVTIAEVLPAVRHHLDTYLSWNPYVATPDYDARPEPGHGPRIHGGQVADLADVERMAMERMLAGVSTRRYPAALEPVGERVSAASRSTSKSAVSRKFVAMTETALGDLLAVDLSGLDLVALMIDGVHFADHLCVVALGIDIDGTKHPLAIVEGSTENTTLVKSLLVGLRERGLDVTKPTLVVLDGAKALSAAVREVFDHPVIGRCQIHKLRNVRDHLPEKLRGPVTKRIRAAYHANSALEAEALLEALAKELDKTHPGAAGSLREGMLETLIVLRLDVPPTLARTLRSTNAIESMIGICREHAKNVKRWRDGQMALRWCAAGMVEATGQFRRINGHLHLPALRAALEAHVAATTAAATVGAECNTQTVNVA